jgi:hypothetical protein
LAFAWFHPGIVDDGPDRLAPKIIIARKQPAFIDLAQARAKAAPKSPAFQRHSVNLVAGVEAVKIAREAEFAGLVALAQITPRAGAR